MRNSVAVKRPQHLIRLYNRILTEVLKGDSMFTFGELQEEARKHGVLFVSCIACTQLQLIRDISNWKCYNSKCPSNKDKWKEVLWRSTQ